MERHCQISTSNWSFLVIEMLSNQVLILIKLIKYFFHHLKVFFNPTWPFFFFLLKIFITTRFDLQILPYTFITAKYPLTAIQTFKIKNKFSPSIVLFFTTILFLAKTWG